MSTNHPEDRKAKPPPSRPRHPQNRLRKAEHPMTPTTNGNTDHRLDHRLDDPGRAGLAAARAALNPTHERRNDVTPHH